MEDRLRSDLLEFPLFGVVVVAVVVPFAVARPPADYDIVEFAACSHCHLAVLLWHVLARHNCLHYQICVETPIDGWVI